MKKNLNDWLIQQGINQLQFAGLVESSPSTVSRLLKGQFLPSLDLGVRIERVTGGWMKCSDWLDEPGAELVAGDGGLLA